MDYAELDRQRCELVKASELWQFDLMKPQKLVSFARDRSIPIFNAHTVEDLFRAGLLRADAVTSAVRIDAPSLTFVGEENGALLYCDMRPIPHRREGYGGIFSKEKAKPSNLELYFHPFRLYVLYHVDRAFRSVISSTQYLLNPEGLVSLSRGEIEHLNHWTSGGQYAQLFEHWNRVAELAIVLEPTAYGGVFHSIRWRFPDSEDTIEAKLDQHRDQVEAMLSGISREEIDRFRQDLCLDAERVDRNKIVHVLLRLMSAHERLKLRSSLGAAMLFLSMAEIIRRAAEEAKGEQFPEEDELGFGQWMDGARRSIYGAERILDASREVRRDFLTSMGLDYGVKVKCYLEGETELGAMTSAAGDGAGAEFINLRGQVIEKKGKGLGFVESLRIDKKSHVFSIVLLDGDNTDNVRAIKKAAKDGSFFGRFFIASPDFEFANFTINELVDVVLALAARGGHPVPPRDDILPHVKATNSGKEFFAALKSTGLCHIEKSADWGEALMAHAIRHPQLPQRHRQAGKDRPVIEAAQLVINARRSGYMRSLARFEVDPETGELREKQATGARPRH